MHSRTSGKRSAGLSRPHVKKSILVRIPIEMVARIRFRTVFPKQAVSLWVADPIDEQ